MFLHFSFKSLFLNFQFPIVEPGWTPLHVVSAYAQLGLTKLLLDALADPNIHDKNGYTPLDVVGLAIDPKDINKEK